MKHLTIGLWLAFASCRRDPPPDAKALKANSADPTSEEYVAPELPRGRVLLHDAYGGTHAVEVEIATTTAARNRGMMWRRELPEGRGMLFVFRTDSDQGFWMRNTLIPLDLLFIDSRGKIVGIVPQATPRSLTTRSVGQPSRFVLEVPGGWSEKQGIVPGCKVEIEGASMLPVEP